MIMHSSTQEECRQTLSLEEFKILRISAIAEIISNARMGVFGDALFQETSFKIKFKKIKRNGNDF